MKKVILLACVIVVSGFASCAEYRSLLYEAKREYYDLPSRPKQMVCGGMLNPNANTTYCKNLKNKIAKYEYLIDECDRRARQEQQQDELQRKLYELDRKLNELNRR